MGYVTSNFPKIFCFITRKRTLGVSWMDDGKTEMRQVLFWIDEQFVFYTIALTGFTPQRYSGKAVNFGAERDTSPKK